MSLRTWCCMHALLLLQGGRPFALVTDVICRTTRTFRRLTQRAARQRFLNFCVSHGKGCLKMWWQRRRKGERGSEESICFLGQAKTRCSSFGFGGQFP
uniref:Putative secreted protein n=1 Tax=Anopheles darlingi TaxID=43151 RepID=A0A2M4DAU5_ANODA